MTIAPFQNSPPGFFCRLDQVFPAFFPNSSPSSSSVLGRIGGCSVEGRADREKKKKKTATNLVLFLLPPPVPVSSAASEMSSPNPRKGLTHFCQRRQIIFIFASFVRFAERRFKIATTLYLQAPFVFRASG